MTSMGGRMLRKWVEQPLLSIPDIRDRLDAVNEIRDKFMPFGSTAATAAGFIFAILLYVIKVLIITVIIGLIEINTVKLRIFSVPNLAAIAFILSVIGFMLLLSGGIDSPVAGWMMAKRGVEIEAIHFYSYPYTSERAKDKVIQLAKILTGYCYRVNLHIVPFTDIQLAINEKSPEDQMTVIMCLKPG